MRRNYRMETVQTVLSLAVIICAGFLFFKSEEYPFLFPVVFGLACILAVIYALEGVAFNKKRVTRKSRVVLFMILAVILAVMTFFAARTVFG